MGLLFLSTPRAAWSLFAIFRERIINIIILLRSLADLSGAFDTPKAKCPPDGGSSDWVTDSPAPVSSNFASYFSSQFQPSSTSQQINKLNNVGRPIPIPRLTSARSGSNASTPSLTPDDDSDYGSIETHTPPSGSFIEASEDPDQASLEFLMNLFPRDGLQALPYAQKVSISTPNMGAVFDGVVLEAPNQPKTFYVDGKSAEIVNLRESIVALLDLADERLGCSALVIVLERASPNLSSLLHSLMYVGGTVVTKPVYQIDPAYVLVGLEI